MEKQNINYSDIIHIEKKRYLLFRVRKIEEDKK